VTQQAVLELIKNLVALQKIDIQIYQIRKDLKQKPDLLAERREQFESKKARLKELETQHKNLQVKGKEMDLELQSKEDAIAKASAQLSQIKTNKEYTAKVHEIENIKADKSIVEEKILMSFEEADRFKSAIAQEKEVLADEEKKFDAETKHIEDEIQQLKGRLTKHEQERQQITPHVDAATLNRYEKILVNKDGLAIVPLQGNVCGGCYMNIPAQVINDIKSYEKLIFCELCARILYLPEDIEAMA